MNNRLGFKANIPEDFYNNQAEFNVGVWFGKTYGYVIAAFPGVSMDYLYNYAKQQQRIRALSVIKDEYIYTKDLPTRKCLFKSRSLHCEVNYVQGKRSPYIIGFFMPTDKIENDEVFKVMNAVAAFIWSDKLQSILESFEELPSFNPIITQYEYEDGPGTLMAKRGLTDIGVGW